VELVEESVRIERALSRPPLIRLNGKEALDRGWPSGPFQDPERWRARLVGHATNVGLVMGRGLLALDVDLYKVGAEDAWQALRDDTGLDDDTVRAITGRGGMHALFRYPPELRVPSVPLGPRGYDGIEVKADGGMIVVAPSVSPETGRPYCWEDGWAPGEHEVREASEKLLALVGAGHATTSSLHWHPLNDDELAALNPADVEVARLLCENFGGHDPALVHGTMGVWRPGKSPADGSASVTVGHIGPGVARCWTDGWPGLEQGRVYDLAQLRQMAGIAPTIAVPSLTVPRGYRLWRPGDDIVPDPVLARDAYIGPVGEYLDLLDGQTEAHPAAVGAQLLASLGTLIGRRACYRAGRIVHHCNLFVAVIGPSSEGAKGVADTEALALVGQVLSSFVADHSIGGLGSGEALVRELADDQDPPAEKCRIVIDAELSAVLKVVKRDGSILGDVLRKAFDYTALRHSTVSNQWVIATGHHIAIVGSITPEELRALIDGLSVANGFANRFMYVWSRITNWLPDGGAIDAAAVGKIADTIRDALAALDDRLAVNGTVHLELDPAAKARWATFYRQRRTGTGTGVVKALTSRQVAQAARLALIYAVLDGAVVIRPEHIDAAIAWCDYSTHSATKAFGGTIGGKTGTLLTAIRAAGDDGLDGTAQHAVFHRAVKAEQLAALREELEDEHLIITTTIPSGGRPRVVSYALSRTGPQ
jgi:hypothetical protein